MFGPGAGQVCHYLLELAFQPDMPGILEEKGWPGHVREGGRTCPAKLTGTRSRDRICSDFSGKLDWKCVFYDLHFTNSLNASR
jgi:hypothetical protein